MRGLKGLKVKWGLGWGRGERRQWGSGVTQTKVVWKHLWKHTTLCVNLKNDLFLKRSLNIGTLHWWTVLSLEDVKISLPRCGMFPYELLVGDQGEFQDTDLRDNTGYCWGSWLPTITRWEDRIDKVTAYLDYQTWRNQARTGLKNFLPAD